MIPITTISFSFVKFHRNNSRIGNKIAFAIQGKHGEQYVFTLRVGDDLLVNSVVRDTNAQRYKEALEGRSPFNMKLDVDNGHLKFTGNFVNPVSNFNRGNDIEFLLHSDNVEVAKNDDIIETSSGTRSTNDSGESSSDRSSESDEETPNGSGLSSGSSSESDEETSNGNDSSSDSGSDIDAEIKNDNISASCSNVNRQKRGDKENISHTQPQKLYKTVPRLQMPIHDQNKRQKMKELSLENERNVLKNVIKQFSPIPKKLSPIKVFGKAGPGGINGKTINNLRVANNEKTFESMYDSDGLKTVTQKEIDEYVPNHKRIMMKKISKNDINNVNLNFFNNLKIIQRIKVIKMSQSQRFWLALKFASNDNLKVLMINRKEVCNIFGIGLTTVKRYLCENGGKPFTPEKYDYLSPVEFYYKRQQHYFREYALNYDDLVKQGLFKK